jgi:hypothetical protein
MKSSLPINETKIVIAAIITLSFITLGAVINRYYLPQVEIETNQTTNEQFIKLVNATVVFYSKIFGDRDRTFVFFPFKFDAVDFPVWLQLESGESNSYLNTRLIHHPQLDQLAWPKITNDNLTLFQKEPKYKTIEEFLKYPPTQSVVVSDSMLVYEFPQLNAVKLTNTIEIDQANYILTTFKPARRVDNTYIFEHLFDATNAEINLGEELVWLIDATDASEENPFYIGNIQIDYRR